MDYRILGPLEVWDGDRALGLGGAKQRALLADLLIHAGEVLSTDRLIDDLWGENPPDTAQSGLQVYVSKLRKLLGGGAGSPLVTRAPGYGLQVRPGELDLHTFERLAKEGRQALGERDAARASARFKEALDLYRGEPLSDFAYEAFAQATIERLEELRLSVLEDRVDTDLALGRHRELVPELEALSKEHPLRERLRAELMVALYRSGRQADALSVYQQARTALADELGIDPGPELRRLEKAILEQNPEIEWVEPESKRMVQRELTVEPTPMTQDSELVGTNRSEAQRAFGLHSDGSPRECPSCGMANDVLASFCQSCGSSLSSRAPDEERKVVTVLFCDLVGFTASSEDADPEDVRAALVPYHQAARREIERFGGTIEKFIGDAVMGVFGAPVAHEDDAERAVRAGLRILEAIDELNNGNPHLELAVRLGINTGETLVSLGARPERGEAMVAGDVVNTASRLQGVAPVGGLIVGKRTYLGTKEDFEWEALGPISLKGKSEPVQAWRALAARARVRVDVVRSRRPLVGRDTDLTILQAAFEKCVLESCVQMVTVGGAPGVGKSRLVEELFAIVDSYATRVRWREGQSLPYGDGVTFWALGEIVKAEAGILESDPLEDVDRKLQAIAPPGPDQAWIHQRLRPLVGMPAAEASRQENFTAWRKFLESLAEEMPSIFVFEDLHWADPTLLEFIEHVAEFAEDVPMLVVATTRPELYERVPTFGAAARSAARINLSPLSEADTARLTSNLLEQSILPAEVQTAVTSRAGGNPLYAEEYVRLLLDTEILSRRSVGWRVDPEAYIPVPSGVQDLIAARLDTLAPDRKHLLQDASVIGEVFWAGALASMAGRDSDDVERGLHDLSRKELVRTSRSSSMEGDSEHRFSHVLVRDVCYGQIPRRLRARKHVAAAEWIESRAVDRVEDHAEILASHYATALELTEAAGEAAQAELFEKAARMFQLAGDRAMGTDVGVAERRYADGLRLRPDDAALLARYAEALYQRARYAEAKVAYQRAVDAYLVVGDVRAAAEAMGKSGKVLARLGDPRGHVIQDEAVAMLEPLGPSPELVRTLSERAVSRFTVDDNVGTVADAERALTLAGEIGLSDPAILHGLRGAARVYLGDPEGLAETQAALKDSLEQGLGHDAAMLHHLAHAQAAMVEGVQAGLRIAEAGLSFARSRGIDSWALGFEIFRLDSLIAGGAWDEALGLVEELAPRLEEADTYLLFPVRAARAFVHTSRGAPERAGGDCDWLLAGCREEGAEPQSAAIALPLAAAIRLGLGDGRGCLALLREFESWPGLRKNENYDIGLPGTVRTALAAGDLPLAERLASEDPLPIPIADHGRVSVRAALAEARGDLETAAAGYQDAAERWEGFGDPWEQAHALLGRGRSLLGLGRTAEPISALRAARAIFASLQAAPAMMGCDQRLAAASARSS